MASRLRAAFFAFLIVMHLPYDKPLRAAATPDPLTGKYYEKVPDMLTWDEARVEAASRFVGGVPGHLVSIRDAQENSIVQYLGGTGERWIGLTDATGISALDGYDFSLLGTVEAGDTSDLPLPAPGVAPVLGERGAGFAWLTGEPFTYMNWRNGVPADLFGQGDGVHMIVAGVWQDSPAGASLGQPGVGGPALRASTVEYELDLQTPRLHMRERSASESFRDGTGLIVTVDHADELLALPTGHADILDEATADIYSVSFHDPDLGGGLPDYVRRPYLLDNRGENDDHFAQQVIGQVMIPAAGEWTFAIMAGDRYRLRVGGNEFSGSGTLPNGPATLTLADSGSLTAVDGGSGSTFYFPTAGVYGLNLTSLESDFFAFIQLFAAEGVHALFDPEEFHLVGDLVNDGLSIVGSQNPDFNFDGRMDCSDIDALTQAIATGSSDPGFDLNYDGIVNVDDLESWLVGAGAANLGAERRYVAGDANLDGKVDGSDFSVMGGNLFSVTGAWCSGDFNIDGVVDGSDFGLWNSNKLIASAAVSVPEATGSTLLLGLVLGLPIRKRARRNRSSAPRPNRA